MALHAIPYLYRRFYNNGCGGSQLKHAATCALNTYYTWRFSSVHHYSVEISGFNYFSLVKALKITIYSISQNITTLGFFSLFVLQYIRRLHNFPVVHFLNIKSYFFNILFYINTLLFILALLNKVSFFNTNWRIHSPIL